MAEGHTVLSSSEVDDLRASLKQFGYAEADFESTQTRDPTPPAPVSPISGTVTIKRKSTGQTRTYAAGHGSSWPATFHDELLRGVFGKP